ncbi:RNA methyltransferase [Mariniflexile litorale]|uniref:RNA methyltransferase n=1 Tax=Mariniflexile litorale TaxID=3045158 RepID=A0AAU7EG48_9FLAO|nr:RNA methyltransferase [Mariniflexile sp. KMM 9835]MDQ8211822.1 RNA methyltransferase [Mariniflexile sp. KMM 9835]
MAFDAFLADRIRQQLKEKHIYFSELGIMGGLCFKVDNKMLCGIHFDKKFGNNLLMARVGEAVYESELEKPNCLPMDFTGRPMKGYIFVTPDGFDADDDLSYWLDLCLAFNPLAKASKPKKKIK